MHDPMKTKSFTAGGAISPYRILKFGADDASLVQGAAATDYLVAIADNLGAASGERVEAITHGFAEVEYGGSVTRGGPLTADSDGKAVAASPAGGSNVRIIGFAMKSGVAGDIGSCDIAPGVMQG